jgi:hypothetical protein
MPGNALTLAVASPDELRLWPTEHGYGLDLTWRGTHGLQAAERVRDALTAAGIQNRLLQGMARDWTLRVGPSTSTDVRRVIDAFLPA